MDAQNACTWVENRGVNLKNQLQELDNLTREEKIELIEVLPDILWTISSKVPG